MFEALVKSGASDSLAGGGGREGRARQFAAIDAACDHGARNQRDRDLGQTQLFGGDEAAGSADMTMLPSAIPWTEIEQLQYEKDALGLYWSGHPMDSYADALREFGAKTTGDLNGRKAINDNSSPDQVAAEGRHGNGSRTSEDISFGGVVSGLRPLKTRKGHPMCVITVDDAQGSVEVVVFPEPFKQYGHLAEAGQMVLVKGRLEGDDESTRILASEILPISAVIERLTTSVAITLSAPPHNRDTFMQLWEVLLQHKGDRRVAIDLIEPERHFRVKLEVNAQIRVRPSERLVSDIEHICGAGSVTLR